MNCVGNSKEGYWDSIGEPLDGAYSNEKIDKRAAIRVLDFMFGWFYIFKKKKKNYIPKPY